MDSLSVELPDDLYPDDDIYALQVKPYCDKLLRRLLAHMPAKLEHSNRVGSLTFKTALQMGHNRQQSLQMGEAARLHDIGYFMHPVSTWVSENKPDPGEKLRRKLLHTHDGSKVIMGCPAEHSFITLAAEGAMEHHELLNGNGPYGKMSLSPFIEILGACDAYDGDAILKPGVTPKTSQEILNRMTTAAKYENGYRRDVLAALSAVEGLSMPTSGMAPVRNHQQRL